jgi:hypothetical protein
MHENATFQTTMAMFSQLKNPSGDASFFVEWGIVRAQLLSRSGIG